MAGDRTEQATPRRKQKARDDGDRVRSRELLQAAGVLAGALCLRPVATGWVEGWKGSFARSLALGISPFAVGDDPGKFALGVRSILLTGLLPFALVLSAVAGATLVTGMAQNGGFSIHPKALAPKWTRLNPGSNLKQIVSTRAIARLGKSLVPFGAIAVLAWRKLAEQQVMPWMSLARLPSVFSDSYDLLLDAPWLMLAWAALDYLIEWRGWEKRMRMSKQEMREEYKESEGNPQMKGRIRSLQRQMRRRKIKADVGRASVVITNPTHYAVALSFDYGTMEAPKVLAKGRDLFAEQIKTEARWAGIPILENPPLARSLFRSVEPGQSIPFELYAAVAGILAYLYRKEMEDRMRRQAVTGGAEGRTRSNGPPESTKVAAAAAAPTAGKGGRSENQVGADKSGREQL